MVMIVIVTIESMRVSVDMTIRMGMSVGGSSKVATLHVIGHQGLVDKLTAAVGMKIIAHVIPLQLHVVTKLIEAGCADQLTLAVC